MRPKKRQTRGSQSSNNTLKEKNSRPRRVRLSGIRLQTIGTQCLPRPTTGNKIVRGRADEGGHPGDWSCLSCLATYFTKQVVKTTEMHTAPDVLKRQSEEMDPMILAELVTFHGVSTSQARDHVHDIRRQNQKGARPKHLEETSVHQDTQQKATTEDDERFTLDDLPPEILVYICSYLPFKTLCHLGAMSRKLRGVMMMDQLWEYPRTWRSL